MLGVGENSVCYLEKGENKLSGMRLGASKCADHDRQNLQCSAK